MLRSRAELYRNPDFWFISNGVLQESVLKIPSCDFQHLAVYSAQADPDTGENVRAVTHQEWRSSPADGPVEVHDNVCVADPTFTGWVLTMDDLMIHNGPEIMAAMEESLRLPHEYSVEVQRAPPGSGKTYSIVHSVATDGSEAVMCPVRESIEDTRREIVKLHPNFPDAKLYVRTLDSYLTNHGFHNKTKALAVGVLRADECYMAHAGKLYATMALLGASKLVAYGDEKQIPHIPRVQAPKAHVKLKSDAFSDVFTTRRCPATAVAAWGSVYEWKVRGLSAVQDAGFDSVVSTRGLEVPAGCVMMCMYQADKLALRKQYANHPGGIQVLTAHEAEGKTYKHVWLHRSDVRKRSDSTSLFDQQPHALVACSRHTHSFKYVRPVNLGDLVESWVAGSKNPRRVAAALDVASAGTVLEML